MIHVHLYCEKGVIGSEIDFFEECVRKVVGLSCHTIHIFIAWSEIGISSRLESQVKFHKTPLQINVIGSSFYVNVNWSDARRLGWYFEVPVTGCGKIRERNSE